MRGDEKFAKDIQNATVQLQNLQNQMLSYLKNTPNLSASTRNAIPVSYTHLSQEYVYLEDTGCAVMMGAKMGIYTISG